MRDIDPSLTLRMTERTLRMTERTLRTTERTLRMTGRSQRRRSSRTTDASVLASLYFTMTGV